MVVTRLDGTADVRVQLCGRFAFMVADEAVHSALPGRRARLLLAYLAAHRDRPTSRTQLLDALWPDGGAHLAATLTVVLSKVRALIAPAEISGRGRTSARSRPEPNNASISPQMFSVGDTRDGTGVVLPVQTWSVLYGTYARRHLHRRMDTTAPPATPRPGHYADDHAGSTR
jgi:hypothetical protein